MVSSREIKLLPQRKESSLAQALKKKSMTALPITATS
jgi:hypothetical protein